MIDWQDRARRVGPLAAADRACRLEDGQRQRQSPSYISLGPAISPPGRLVLSSHLEVRVAWLEESFNS